MILMNMLYKGRQIMSKADTDMILMINDYVIYRQANYELLMSQAP